MLLATKWDHERWAADLNNLTDQELKRIVAKAVAQAQGASSPPNGQDGGMPVVSLTAAEAARLIDHTLLKPEVTEAQIRQLCAEAKEFRFASVCINPTWISLCRGLLIDSPVKVCTVIGFPLGATLPEVKGFEAERAIQAGAHEVDMVINIGRLKSGAHQVVFQDISAVVAIGRRYGALVKAILEMPLLTEEEKVAACALAQAAGVDFVKTSTGFGGGGATVADVALMRRVVGPTIGVKAAGGIRTATGLRQMVNAGANRIGTSAGVQIVTNFDEQPERDSATADATGEPY
jgi:deoxyribose-phosphate aldolase